MVLKVKRVDSVEIVKLEIKIKIIYYIKFMFKGFWKILEIFIF